jgi:acetyltransferase-like isoleucine patch superfamily enzyme
MRKTEGIGPMGRWRDFIDGCRRVIADPNRDISVTPFLLRSLRYHLMGKRVFAYGGAEIRHPENIGGSGTLLVGTGYVGFLHERDRAFLNINGSLRVEGVVGVGKGCRFDVVKGAVCEMTDCTFTGDSRIVIAESLLMGAGTVVAWGCEFLDRDWHTIRYEGRKERGRGIVVGKHVWIGSHVRILKGVRIPDDCVVASGSVVVDVFDEPGCLIAGSPAKVVRRGISWS